MPKKPSAWPDSLPPPVCPNGSSSKFILTRVTCCPIRSKPFAQPKCSFAKNSPSCLTSMPIRSWPNVYRTSASPPSCRSALRSVPTAAFRPVIRSGSSSSRRPCPLSLMLDSARPATPPKPWKWALMPSSSTPELRSPATRIESLSHSKWPSKLAVLPTKSVWLPNSHGPAPPVHSLPSLVEPASRSMKPSQLNASRVRQLLTAATKTRILVVGDIMLDHFIWGNVSRISPEAPVPVVDFIRESHMPGGAANVARNLSALGAPTELFGIAGRDDAGKRLKDLLTEHHVD